MKKTTLMLALAFAGFSAFAQVKMPQPSPTQSIKQDFGMGNIVLTYSRPAMKDRKIFGDLVPYNKLWRTGANAATKIQFNEPVSINGKNIDTGSYALYTIPGTDSWEIILNKGISNWGIDGYKESDDVLRTTVPSIKIKPSVENFTMQLMDIKPESCNLMISWEKTAVIIPITTNIKDKLRAQVETSLQSDKKPYWQAAQFYNEYDKNSAKALENITKACDSNPNAYWMWLYKARIQKDMGDNAGSLVSANKSLELAQKDNNADYVKMCEDLIRKLK